MIVPSLIFCQQLQNYESSSVCLRMYVVLILGEIVGLCLKILTQDLETITPPSFPKQFVHKFKYPLLQK